MLVDAHMLGSHETGNETYVSGLLSALPSTGIECGAAILGQETQVEWYRGIVPIRLKHPSDWARLAFELSGQARRWQADVLHVTYVGPLHTSCSLVVSVHDVAFRRFPEFFSPKDRILFGTLLPLTLRRADAVVTLSSSAREEIEEFYPYLRGRVYVTSLAASPLFHPMDQQTAAKAMMSRYGLEPGFVLAVGNLQPRKNLCRLVQAFAQVRHQIGSLHLVIVGGSHRQSSDVFDAVMKLGIKDDVTFTGYVPESDLPLFYNSAAVFAYPSVYEGFGLPIVEAMACGTPVVTSSTSSMPEVAGDAALLVDPYSTDEIAAALRSVLTRPALAHDLGLSGLARSSQFSWERTARETVAIYNHVLAER